MSAGVEGHAVVGEGHIIARTAERIRWDEVQGRKHKLVSVLLT